LTGLDLQQLIAADRHDMPIIFITGYGNVPMSVQAMKAGAAEFLTKPIDDQTLMTAIRHAIERSKAKLEDDGEVNLFRSRWGTLTPRERDVTELVVSGLLNKQIGYQLGISEVTVKAHRGKAMLKMKADSLADMVRIAGRLGIDPSRNPWRVERRPDDIDL